MLLDTHAWRSPVGCLSFSLNGNGSLVRLGFTTEREGFVCSDRARAFCTQLEAYFRGELRTFDIAVEPEGTAFQLKVWEELLRIPYGRTRSYGEVARRLRSPGAERAVGMANNRNPIAIVIPCHRVIGVDGSLTGYGGGLPIKRALLELEGARASQMRLEF